jgi:hypothetical protein
MFGSTNSIKKIISGENDVTDISDQFPTAVKAEQQGNNILILRNIDPIKRLDKKMANLELEHCWLRDSRDVTSVLGSDYSYWQKKELKWNECIFDQVNIF